jgi:hypothetical protein
MQIESSTQKIALPKTNRSTTRENEVPLQAQITQEGEPLAISSREKEVVSLFSEKLLISLHGMGKQSVVMETLAALFAFFLDGGNRVDYLAHFGARMAELLRDFPLEQEKIPKQFVKPLLALARLFNIRDVEGQNLTESTLSDHKEKLFGAASVIQGIPFVLLSALKPSLQYLKQADHKVHLTPRKVFSIILNAISAPIMIIMSCPIGQIQRKLAPLALKLNPAEHDLYEQSMISGNDHWNRGFQSVLLAFSQLTGNLLPKLNPFIETGSGLLISGSSMFNGFKLLNNSADKSNVCADKPWDKNPLFDTVYKFGEKVINMLTKSTKNQLKLPDTDKIKTYLDDPTDDNLMNLYTNMFPPKKAT